MCINGCTIEILTKEYKKRHKLCDLRNWKKKDSDGKKWSRRHGTGTDGEKFVKQEERLNSHKDLIT